MADEAFLFRCGSKHVCPSACGNSHKPSVVRLCVRLDSLGSWACILKLKVKDRSLCLLQVYALNAVSEYQTFVDDVKDALRRVGSTESTIILGDFNVHIVKNSEHGKA